MALRGKVEVAVNPERRVSGGVVATSVWIEFFAGRSAVALEAAVTRASSGRAGLGD